MQLFELAKEYEETEYASVAFLRMAQAKRKLGYKKTAIEYCRKAVDKAQTNEKLASEVLLRMFFIVGPGEVEKYCSEKLQSDPDSLPQFSSNRHRIEQNLLGINFLSRTLWE